jgi:hypothetical protein
MDEAKENMIVEDRLYKHRRMKILEFILRRIKEGKDSNLFVSYLNCFFSNSLFCVNF